jgi:hypothetical protein
MRRPGQREKASSLPKEGTVTTEARRQRLDAAPPIRLFSDLARASIEGMGIPEANTESNPKSREILKSLEKSLDLTKRKA